jgi:hypothetical protein
MRRIMRIFSVQIDLDSDKAKVTEALVAERLREVADKLIARKGIFEATQRVEGTLYDENDVIGYWTLAATK